MEELEIGHNLAENEMEIMVKIYNFLTTNGDLRTLPLLKTSGNPNRKDFRKGNLYSWVIYNQYWLTEDMKDEEWQYLCELNLMISCWQSFLYQTLEGKKLMNR